MLSCDPCSEMQTMIRTCPNDQCTPHNKWMVAKKRPRWFWVVYGTKFSENPKVRKLDLSEVRWIGVTFEHGFVISTPQAFEWVSCRLSNSNVTDRYIHIHIHIHIHTHTHTHEETAYRDHYCFSRFGQKWKTTDGTKEKKRFQTSRKMTGPLVLLWGSLNRIFNKNRCCIYLIRENFLWVLWDVVPRFKNVVTLETKRPRYYMASPMLMRMPYDESGTLNQSARW